MTPGHDRALCEAFPRLYRERHAPVTESGMGWGFACGDGWFSILWELSRAISGHAERAGLDPAVTQVKEKFGELRVYVEGGDEEIERLVEEAVERSRGTCGVCGSMVEGRMPAGSSRGCRADCARSPV